MVLVSAIMTLCIVVQDNAVQTLAVRMAADWLSGKLGVDVRIGAFSLSFSNGIVIGDILVKDNRDTTLFASRELGIKPAWLNLARRQIIAEKLFVGEGEFRLMIHSGDSALNLQLIIDHFASREPVTGEPPASSAPWKISCRKLELRKFRFCFRDANQPPSLDGMDYSNIDVQDINLHVSDLHIDGDTVNATIGSLSARERCGFNLQEFRGTCRVSGKFIEVRRLKVKTDNSDISLDFAFRYRDLNAFSDFLRRVTIEADIRPSDFDMTDIGFFAPDVRAMRNKFRLEGIVKGTVSKFRAENFRAVYGAGTLFQGDVFAVGLPDVLSTYVDLKIDTLTTNAGDVGSFLLPGDPGRLEVPALLTRLDIIRMKGEFTGFFDDFISRSEIRTGLGEVFTNLQLKKGGAHDPLEYKGELRVSSFDIGKLTGGESLLGRVTLRAGLNGKGLTSNDADLVMHARIDSAYVNRYNLMNVTVNGSVTGKKFSGELSAEDPNLALTFSGTADFSNAIPVFNFYSRIGNAQLFNLRLLDRDSTEVFSGSVAADFSGSNLDNAVGSLKLRDISYREGEKLAVIDSVLIKTVHTPDGGKSYQVRSDLLDADFSGEFAFSKLVPSLVAFTRNYLASFEMKKDSGHQYHSSGQELAYRIEFKKTDELTSIFLPFLRIAAGSYLQGRYSEDDKLLAFSGRSPMIRAAGCDLQEWYVEAETRTDSLTMRTGCSRLFLSRTNEKDTTYIQLDTLLLSSVLRNDSVLFRLSSSSGRDHSFSEGFLAFPEGGSIKISLNDLDLNLAGNSWTVSKGNYIIVDTSSIEIRDLAFSSLDQLFSLDGRISESQSDTLALTFRGMNVSEADYFLANPYIDIDGILSGTLRITDLYNELSVFSDLRLDNFSFNREHLGDAVLKVNYNRNADRFDVVSEIIYTGNIGQNIPFSLTGSYFTGRTEPYFDFDLRLKNLNLMMLQPFVSDFMSKLTGLASGEVKITGTFREPSFRGELKLMRTEFNISYLNVPYSVSDVIAIEPDRLAFNDIVLYDSLGNKAYLNGAITHDHFRDIKLDLNIRMNDFSAFRNSLSQNSTFYGHARATGTVQIKGPVDNITIAVKAQTGSNTLVTIPISLTQDVGQVDYIIFVEPRKDTVDSIPGRTGPPRATGLTLAMDLDVRPDAQVEVIFPDQLGNIRASGYGNLSMGMTPTVPFNLLGTYSISKGSFLFQMKNLIRLPFSIREGSSISWTGDPTDATISLSAIYKTKVPLTGLSYETSSIQGRIPVECIIRLNGKLMNPVMSFGLALPNAQENERNLVFNAIDTNNASEMAQQVLYILVMNQFKPVTGGTEPSIDVTSTSLAIVTNQISTWLSGMSQNLNIGVNYKPGTSTSNQEFDMTVSTQLFDDRLLIDGTFGMSSYKNTSAANASTIVGDINIEYILTKNRRWRLRAFNRTNTIDVLNNNAPYTQGVGISYQRDFYTWKELFRRTGAKR